jgi:soluble lytic murein transglycosylase-like protein
MSFDRIRPSGSFVRVRGAIRYLAWTMPVAASFLVTSSLIHQSVDESQLTFESRATLRQLDNAWAAISRSEVWAAEARAAALSAEQYNVARYVATNYRIALDSAQEFVYHAYRAAADLQLDPLLVLAVMSVESNFDPLAQSHKGAQGLMQVLTRVHEERFEPFGGVTAAFDPKANIRVGSSILREYIDREGTVEAALKSYVGAAMLSHDRGYGAKVLRARERLALAAAAGPAARAAGLEA